MHATVGERIRFHGRTVGAADHSGEIVTVKGEDGQPPYVVRFDDGHEALVYPGADCEIEHADPKGG
ncbi:DUF1918 domain-containing protein [Mumia sp. DW29H23]|uniref:DUF1918 domain-containing protein n=1 Tax=Mumia sp. DW29H23 TaxID=3421241 RepID=UPI003D696EF6